jgi:hypothetical protein
VEEADGVLAVPALLDGRLHLLGAPLREGGERREEEAVAEHLLLHLLPEVLAVEEHPALRHEGGAAVI